MSTRDELRPSDPHDAPDPSAPDPSDADFDEAEADVEAHGLDETEDEGAPIIEPNAVCG